MAKTVGRILVGDFPISQIFGVNAARYAQFGLNGHNGIDIAAPLETTVLAGVSGIVIFVGSDPGGYGTNVRVWDQVQDLLLIFAHLNSVAPLIQIGLSVTPNNPIGGVGSTGNSTGPHLHFGVYDTFSNGMVTNLDNGFRGAKNPLDTNFLNLNYPKVFLTGGAPVTSTTQPAYGGPEPPSYPPTHAGQTVSWLGNNFRSDDGTTWIFQGSDAERAAAGELEKKRELAELAAKAADAGAYLQKSNLSQQYTEEGVFPAGGGLADAEFLVITGPYEARVNPDATMTAPWSQWYTTPGRYTMTMRTERIEVKKKASAPPTRTLAGDTSTTAGDNNRTGDNYRAATSSPTSSPTTTAAGFAGRMGKNKTTNAQRHLQQTRGPKYTLGTSKSSNPQGNLQPDQLPSIRGITTKL